MEKLYDIYFRGELSEGADPAAVRARLAALFKADDKTLERLFSGKAQMIKKACDKATALKYKQAMEKAGAIPVITASSGEPAPASTPAEQARPAMTAAERIAALAAAPDAATFLDDTARAASPEPDSTAPEPAADGDISLAPPGTEVLHASEREPFQPRDVDTSAMVLAETGSNLSNADATPAPPPPPDTSHLSVGELGDTIPTLVEEHDVPVPDIEAIELCPEGTEFTDCHTEVEPLELDLEALALEPEGTSLLDITDRPQVPPPATDHLSLEP